MQTDTLRNATAIPREIALGAVNIDRYAEWRGRQACIEKAQSKPLPGASGKAFASGPVRAAGKIVNRVVPSHFAVLQSLDSPLLSMIENAMGKKSVDVSFKPHEQWQICYVFTEDAEEVYTLLETEGAKAVAQAAKKAVGMGWEASAVNLVMLAVLEQIKRHVETTVKFAAEMEAQGDVSFFQELKTKA